MESSHKSKRPNLQHYIPVHRRKQQDQTDSPSSSITSRTISREDFDVKKRGRGQFRAPLPNDIGTINNIDNGNDQLESDGNKTIKQSTDSIQEVIIKLKKLETNGEIEHTEEKEDWEEDWEREESRISPQATMEKPIEQNQNLVAFDEDPTTVLDCYDFPSSFKTHHLQDLFKEFGSLKGGYSIKWMDDTRALIIFEHPHTARKAFIRHANSLLVKIRPYKGQIESKSSGPVPKRPLTTDMVARRLVHGALGVRSYKTAEQRKAEKDLIKAAKEKREIEKANDALKAQQIANAFDEKILK